MADVDRSQVMGALARVDDPELGRSLVELGMIRDVDIDGGRVSVHLMLTVQGCPMRRKMKGDIRREVRAVPGVEEVDVRTSIMTDSGRERLLERLQGDRPAVSPIMDPDSPTRVVVIASGKGGVGKSTVTVNLATALGAGGHTVGVLDADIYGFSIPRMLGVEGRPRAFNKAILPLDAAGIKVMSMGFFVEEESPVVWRGALLTGAVNQFLRDVLWGDLDYLLVDLPPGTGDVALSIARRLPRAHMIVVTTPQAAAVKVAARAGHMAVRAGLKVLGVVENMARFVCPHCSGEVDIFGPGGADDLAGQLGVPVLGRVPMDIAVREASDSGRPVVKDDPSSPPSRAFLEAARRVTDLLPPARDKERSFER